ncbi:Pentatricopeptide repeat-containing protein [Melia azedarach]|uniref:Pentatricopeptide repeat-containing protein n=1 Tax=Melia azedarach TaxID=155640 RepID=A0ACC1XXD1_MELAZ|nr:Pentatricopeptide repeat-containing protein [Melia azedarach]
MLLSKIKKIPFTCTQFNKFFISYKSNVSCIDPYESCKFLSSYFKSGRTKEAENLFEAIPQKNVVSWSIVIHGYSINGFYKKSVKSFSQLMFSGLFPNSFTMVGVLVATVGLQNLELARSMHGLIVKCGLESDLIVGTAMLDAYGKCGNIFDSYKLFEGLKNPGLVSCNAIVAGLINNELFERAVSLFNRFRRSGLVPNSVTVLTVIRGCVALGSRAFCESIHGLTIKLALILDLCVNNSLLYMYSSLMDLAAASQIFGEPDCKDVISYTTMMGLLVNLEHASDALKIYCKMRKSGILDDMVVIINLISACSVLGDLKRGRQVHARAVVCGFQSELPFSNSIIAMYSKCGDLDSSRTVFDQTTEKSLVSWTAIISGYVQNGCAREALNLFVKMRQENDYSIDSIMLVSVLTASGELAALVLCLQLHCYAFEAGFPHYRSVQNSLISAYSKCGNVDLAHIVFKEMGFLRDVISWNAIISGYGINGHGGAALALYHEMMKGGKILDGATYLCILNACSHAGLINDGLLIFNQMIEANNVKPSQEHHGCVVDLLARAGCLSDASLLAGKLLEGTGPNIWRALLSGCLLHSNVELAELAARQVFEQDPEESGQVVLLSNVYASVGRFQDAEALRSSTLKKRLIKNPGISLLDDSSSDFG